MPDSLRDQLIAAGFDAPKKEARKKPKPGGGKGADKRSKSNSTSTSKGSSRGSSKSSSNSKPSARKSTQGPAQDNSQKKPASHHAGSKAGGSSGKPNTGSRNPNNRNQSSPEQLAKIEERKKLKAQIKTLIDDNKTEGWKGDTVYRYLVDKKIRELYVTDALHPKLTARDVAITRYNGETFIVPRETGKAIKEINPQWSVFNLEKEEVTPEQIDGEYADYQVPDDLQW